MQWRHDTLPLSVRRLQLTFVNESAISYKQLAEAFVTGHTGSNGFTELTVLLLSVGMWLWIHRIVIHSVRRAAEGKFLLLRRLLPPPSAAARAGSFARLLPPLLLEYALLVWPILFSMTLGAEWALQIFAAQIAAIPVLLLTHRAVFGELLLHTGAFRSTPSSSSTAAASGAAPASSSDALVLQRLDRAPKLFITNYRTSLMIYTSIAILAVGQSNR